MIDFRNISYLERGNPRQQKAFGILTGNRIMAVLASFDPLLAGTIPINIDIDGSDLDIICYWKNKVAFISVVNQHFANYQNFKIREAIIGNQETVIASFFIDGIELEIFGQNTPSASQAAFCHMLVEHQILMEKGERFRNEVIKLKRSGIKTEPAFARLLGLSGDPYAALLSFETEKPASDH